MADPKNNSSSFFRKVVQFVANPTTDWTQLGVPTQESRDSEYARSELKAMIERKRRNDFVRKREFDMLRKVRREGLSAEQLAALGGYSNLDDSEARPGDSVIRPDGGVKAKIDEIEQQMVGDPSYPDGAAQRRPATAPQPATPTEAAGVDQAAYDPTEAASLDEARSAAPSPFTFVPDPQPYDAESTAFANAFSVEVNEVVHDPDLDEAVIAFANADLDQCEQSLVALTSPGGPRAQHADTWLVLFDFYRATGRRVKFESLAIDYAQQFGWSAPQWYSLPQLVADAASATRPARSRIDGSIGWVAPAVLDATGVARLAAQTLRMPLPWVFDWSALERFDGDACARLDALFRGWIDEPLDMRWIGSERLFAVLEDATRTGARDADPACWQLRLDALRMVGRADRFDEAAIDYCITYEVSPPSWEAARCRVRAGGESDEASLPAGPTSHGFGESQPSEGAPAAGSVELVGELVGDIGETLARLDDEQPDAAQLTVSCLLLVRVDFVAAGDLLNWVLARQTEQRNVTFADAHRLVALFFGAMGINEHARVKVRSI